MKQKEERDLENALAWDDETVDMDTVFEAVMVDKEESKRFFKEAGQDIVNGSDTELLSHRRKRVNGNLAKHWFIYEYPGKKEVRLLIATQHINGEKELFTVEVNKCVFSYG
jgi:hypothetical protein